MIPRIETIIDISWPLSDSMTGYKDRRAFRSTTIKNFAQDQVRQTEITIDSHAGTHIDAPAHFLANGDSIDQIPLGNFMGNATVLDLTAVESAITGDHLAQQPIEKDTIILLKTSNSDYPESAPFFTDFIYLAESGANYLVEKKVKAVGIDYLGIERNQPDHATHQLLMMANIPIIEGLRLHNVAADHYFFIALPLKITGAEAAPARAILLK